MANSPCGGMKTLAVSQGQPGATDVIIEETFKKVDGLKARFIDKDPVVKLEAPVVNELGDLPVSQFQEIKKETGKWAVDIVHEWNGSFDSAARTVIKDLAKSYGKADWFTTWDGQYNEDDVLKGLIAGEMVKGRYNALPNPFKPKGILDTPYTMELAVSPVSSGKWHITKVFIFEDRTKMRAVDENLKQGILCGLSWWSANTFAAKKIFQKLFEGLGGFQVRYCLWPGEDHEPVDLDKIAAGYAFMRSRGPISNNKGEFHEWVDTFTKKEGSPIHGWLEGKCKSFLADCAKGKSTARTIDFNFTTYKDFKPWFLDLVLKDKIASHKEHGILWAGVSECGKSLGSKTHGFMISHHWIDTDGRVDLIASIATAKYIDMFRGERNSVYKPCTFDDGKVFEMNACDLKPFLYPAELDALLFARWGGSGFDQFSTRQAVSQQFDAKAAAKHANKQYITDEEFMTIIAPSLPRDADDEDIRAFKRRFHMIVITEDGIFHRSATKKSVRVERIHWTPGEDKDIFMPHVQELYSKAKNGLLKEVPPNYAEDLAWSQQYLKKAMKGEPMRPNMLIAPGVPGSRPAFVSTMQVIADDKVAKQSARNQNVAAPPVQSCAESLEDKRELQKILMVAAQKHHGVVDDLITPPGSPKSPEKHITGVIKLEPTDSPRRRQAKISTWGNRIQKLSSQIDLDPSPQKKLKVAIDDVFDKALERGESLPSNLSEAKRKAVESVQVPFQEEEEDPFGNRFLLIQILPLFLSFS